MKTSFVKVTSLIDKNVLLNYMQSLVISQNGIILFCTCVHIKKTLCGSFLIRCWNLALSDDKKNLIALRNCWHSRKKCLAIFGTFTVLKRFNDLLNHLTSIVVARVEREGVG